MAMRGAKVKNLSAITKRLASKLKTSQSAVDRGMIKGGLLVQREAQRNVPVDVGNLKASARTTWQKGVIGTRVVVSFNTEYAAAVHEVPATHTVGDWKYLERAVVENYDRILQAIRMEAAL